VAHGNRLRGKSRDICANDRPHCAVEEIRGVAFALCFPKRIFTRIMLSDIKLGLNAYFEAFGFVMRHRLWYFFVFPILFSLVALGILFLVKAELIDVINAFLMEWFGLDHEKDDFQGWFGKVLRVLVGIVIWVTATYVFWTFNKYIVLIVLSPVLALLSEKTETILTGKKYPFSVAQLVNDTIRGVLVALRNLIIEVMIIAVFTVTGLLFPIISPFLFILMFVASAYFYGFSMMDYNNERHRLSIREGTRLIRQNRILTVSNGAFFDLLMRVPIVGITFAPILGCVGATLALHRKHDLNNNLKTALH